MDDGRKKAAALFGKEFMGALKGGKSPKQVNSAQALQKRANDRPIPAYKSGGPVKKSDGGRIHSGATANPPPAMGPRAPGGMSADVNAGRTTPSRERRIERNRAVVEAQQYADDRKTRISIPGRQPVNPQGFQPDVQFSDGPDVAQTSAQRRVQRAQRAARIENGREGLRETIEAGNRRPARDMVADARSGPTAAGLAEKKAALQAQLAAAEPGSPQRIGAMRQLARAEFMAAGGAAKKRRHKDGGPIRIDLEKAKKDTKVRDEKREAEYRRKMGSQEEVLKRSERNQAREEREEMPVRRAQGGAAKVRQGIIKGAVKTKKGIGGVM